jgi:hypothetical protein
MSFHVEVNASSSLRHARVFNLTAEELRAIVEPWLAGQAVELGDREWDPRKSTMRILEGPRLDTPDLSFGQGWSNAERSASDVTRQVLDDAADVAKANEPDAFVIEADSAADALEKLSAGPVAQAIAWPEARGRIDGRDPAVAAVILVLRPSEPEPTQS